MHVIIFICKILSHFSVVFEAVVFVKDLIVKIFTISARAKKINEELKKLHEKNTELEARLAGIEGKFESAFMVKIDNSLYRCPTCSTEIYPVYLSKMPEFIQKTGISHVCSKCGYFRSV